MNTFTNYLEKLDRENRLRRISEITFRIRYGHQQELDLHNQQSDRSRRSRLQSPSLEELGQASNLPKGKRRRGNRTFPGICHLESASEDDMDEGETPPCTPRKEKRFTRPECEVLQQGTRKTRGPSHISPNNKPRDTSDAVWDENIRRINRFISFGDDEDEN